MNNDLFELLRIALKTSAHKKMCINDTSSPMYVNDVSFAERQGIAAFIYDGLQKAFETGDITNADVSKDAKMKLISHTMQVEKVHRKHERAIADLANFYAEHGIKMMLMKGYGLSLLYPNPNHRPCGDIDIWLFGEQERADKLLHEEKGIRIDTGHQHHTVFNFDGVMVENHFEFVNVLSHLSNRDIECELRKTAKNGKMIKDERIANLYYPPVNFNALFLLRHAAAHFAGSEIALRHVTDWAMFVKHYHNEIDWEWLECFAKEQNMHRFMHCMNAICIDYIGLPQNMFPRFERDQELEAKVMEDILHPAFPERGDLRKCWWRNYIYTIQRWWGNRWKHRIVYREGMFLTFFVLLLSHFRTKPIMEKA